MSSENAADTDELLRLARDGRQSAVDALFMRHRPRLLDMVRLRMDRRLMPRFDPSDVVQDTLIEAARRLDGYLQSPTLPFYPWLRGLAWHRLIDLHRRHLKTARRNVDREHRRMALADDSVDLLAKFAVSRQSDALQRLMREELRERVLTVLNELSDDHREVLLMRHVERMSVEEIAACTQLPQGTVKSRAFRALKALQRQLASELKGSEYD